MREGLRRRGAVVEISLDLGCTQSRVQREDDRVVFPGGASVRLTRLKRVERDDASIYEVGDEGPRKIGLFSDDTNLYYKLRATGTWPALEISGITMHRIGPTDPKSDVEAKIALLAPIKGRVLDTCTGLGYTALSAAKTAQRVVTVEIDPNVLDLARLNPHSRRLFEDERIEQREGDVAELIGTFGDGEFDLVIHDPPTLAIAGELYSNRFYEQLYRVLRSGGRLFHYTGAPGSKIRSVDLPARVAARLREIGFRSVRRHDDVLSVLAART